MWSQTLSRVIRGGKVSILGGESIGPCEEKVRMNMCLILNHYQDAAVWDYKQKSIVNGNIETEITYSWFNFNSNV